MLQLGASPTKDNLGFSPAHHPTPKNQRPPHHRVGRAGLVCAAGVRSAKAVKNSWKTCKAAQKAVSIMQCPQKIGEEKICPKAFHEVNYFKALRYTQPCIVFRCFLASREDSFAHT